MLQMLSRVTVWCRKKRIKEILSEMTATNLSLLDET